MMMHRQHMRQDSIAVVAGDRVEVSDRLGKISNTGASTEPYLHIKAQRPATEGAPPISGASPSLPRSGRRCQTGKDQRHRQPRKRDLLPTVLR